MNAALIYPRRIVLFVHQSAELYGSDRVLLLLVGQLRDSELRPVVVLPEDGPLHAALLQLGIETHISDVAKVGRATYTPRGLLRWLGALGRSVGALDRIVAGRAVQAVHSNTLAVFGGALWARRRRVPHLWHVHEIILKPRVAAFIFPLFVRLLADRVVANSRGTANWLLGWQPALAPRCTVICNGLAPTPPRDDNKTAAFRAQIGASADEIVVTLVGRINGGKGHDVLLQAAELLQQRGELERFRFVMAGGPPPGQLRWQEDLLRAIAASPARERFTHLPFVDDIWPVWYGSDIAAVPSTLPESFGLVAAEAMAAQLPVVASRQGGLSEIVVHGETGLLLPPGDAQALATALLQLADDASLRAQFGRAGRERQQREFALAQQAEKFLAEYQSLAGAAGADTVLRQYPQT